MSPRKLYVTCLSYSNSLNLRHPFGITHLPNSCEEGSDSFFLPSNDELTHEMDSWSLSIKFINFDKRYEKLSDFTLMQTFNSTPLPRDFLDKLAQKTQELKSVSFQHMNKNLQEINEQYSFVMPKWLLIIITVLGTIITTIIVNMIWYLKYCKGRSKVRHFLS